MNDLLGYVDVTSGNAFKEITGDKFGARQIAPSPLLCSRYTRR